MPMILFLTLLLRQLLVPRQPTIEICCFVLCTLIPDITFIICFDGKVLQQFYSFCVLASILLPDSGHLFKSQEKIFMIPRNFLGGGSSSRKSKILESQLWSQNQNKCLTETRNPAGENIFVYRVNNATYHNIYRVFESKTTSGHTQSMEIKDSSVNHAETIYAALSSPVLSGRGARAAFPNSGN